MTHTVAVGEFEGPLGILLELVERRQLEVTAISVAEITEQYLERVHELDTHSPEELSEFAQLGARLLYIKSLALLPQTTAENQDEELRQLNLELEEYRRFQAAARELAKRVGTRTWSRQIAARPQPQDLPLPQLSLPQLAEAFSRALRRTEPATEPKLLRRHLSIDTVLARLRQRLAAGFALDDVLDACRDRLEVIVTFLALLELIRDGTASVTQASQFEPIRVEAAPAEVAHA
jgi:segregation and condensation protein A